MYVAWETWKNLGSIHVFRRLKARSKVRLVVSVWATSLNVKVLRKGVANGLRSFEEKKKGMVDVFGG